MKLKWLLFSAFMFLLLPKIEASMIDASVEGKIGYLYPTDHATRQNSSGNAIYSLEGNIQVYRQLYAWSSIGYYYGSGDTTNGDIKTNLKIMPIGVGLKYFLPVSYFDLYVGAGVLPTYVQSTTHSPYFKQKIDKWACGGVVKGGVLINITCSFYIDLFVDYMILSAKGKGSTDPLTYAETCNLNSVSVGGGIGYRF